MGLVSARGKQVFVSAGKHILFAFDRGLAMP